MVLSATFLSQKAVDVKVENCTAQMVPVTAVPPELLLQILEQHILVRYVAWDTSPNKCTILLLVNKRWTSIVQEVLWKYIHILRGTLGTTGLQHAHHYWTSHGGNRLLERLSLTHPPAVHRDESVLSSYPNPCLTQILRGTSAIQSVDIDHVAWHHIPKRPADIIEQAQCQCPSSITSTSGPKLNNSSCHYTPAARCRPRLNHLHAICFPTHSPHCLFTQLHYLWIDKISLNSNIPQEAVWGILSPTLRYLSIAMQSHGKGSYVGFSAIVTALVHLEWLSCPASPAAVHIFASSMPYSITELRIKGEARGDMNPLPWVELLDGVAATASKVEKVVLTLDKGSTRHPLGKTSVTTLEEACAVKVIRCIINHQ